MTVNIRNYAEWTELTQTIKLSESEARSTRLKYYFFIFFYLKNSNFSRHHRLRPKQLLDSMELLSLHSHCGRVSMRVLDFMWFFSFLSTIQPTDSTHSHSTRSTFNVKEMCDVHWVTKETFVLILIRFPHTNPSVGAVTEIVSFTQLNSFILLLVPLLACCLVVVA